MSTYTYEEMGKIFASRSIKIGTSVIFEDESSLLKAIQGAVNSGSQHIEIAAMGERGASRCFSLSSSIVSEIRHISELNKVALSLHASPFLNICGFERNGFSSEVRNRAIREAKAAIDFAYTIKAALVVLHPNSFNRSVSEVDPDVFGDDGAVAYYLVDPRSEEIMSISAQESVFIPKQAKDTKGNLLWLLDRDRKHIIDPVTGKSISRSAVDPDGRIRGEQISFAEYARRMKKEGKAISEAVKAFIHLQRTGEINRTYLQIMGAERTLAEAQSRRDRLQDTLDYYRNLDGVLPPEERCRLERTMHDSLNSAGIAVPSDIRSVRSLLEDELRDNQCIIEASRQSLVQGWPQLSDIIEQLRNVEVLEDYGLERIAGSIAELGEYAISVSDGNVISLSIENLSFPYMYGSSTKELIEIIERSRALLAHRLQEIGYGASESKRLSANCIKVTVDIGHLNLFRQYYRGGSFHGWVVSQIKDLASSNVISNIHLSDNRGLDDSHLLVGEGNAPIKEALSALSSLDYKVFIVIEGAGSPGAIKHVMDLFGIVPRATDDELGRDFNPRDAVSGLRWKDDPERPPFGKDD